LTPRPSRPTIPIFLPPIYWCPYTMHNSINSRKEHLVFLKSKSTKLSHL
jgi:hypothetical protein